MLWLCHAERKENNNNLKRKRVVIMSKRKDFVGLMDSIMAETIEPMSWDDFWAECRNAERQDYCKQNNCDCHNCALSSYNKDCKGNKI